MKQMGKWIVGFALRAYKSVVSPWLPPACRYVPTCSEYAMDAVERYGALRGGMLALRRLLRCHPLSRGGFDPVAPRSRKQWALTKFGSQGD
jgi:hypothetical protein